MTEGTDSGWNHGNDYLYPDPTRKKSLRFYGMKRKASETWTVPSCSWDINTA